MTVLLVVFVVVVLVVAALSRSRHPDTAADARAQLNLHRARRRLEVGQFKAEAKRDAARLRRELHDELHGDPPSLNRKRPGVSP